MNKSFHEWINIKEDLTKLRRAHPTLDKSIKPAAITQAPNKTAVFDPNATGDFHADPTATGSGHNPTGAYHGDGGKARSIYAHDDPGVAEALAKLKEIMGAAREVFTHMNKNGFLQKNYTSGHIPAKFKEYMTAAIDGLGRAQALLFADPRKGID